MTVSKIKLTMIGGFCLLVAFFCARDIIAKSGWPQVPAEITAVTVECLMESTQHRIVYKTVSSASIPCELVEAFKSVHADKEWTVKQKFTGTLRVGAGADAVEATMDLNKSGGREPQVGDKLVVVQNPAKATQVERAGMTGTRVMLAVGAAALGALLLFLAFRRPRPSSANVAAAGLPGDNASERARQADAMIAAALAKQATLNNQGPAGRQAAAGLAREARLSGQRTSFGRKS
ncbi:hypothetical protein EN742_03280 [Mesorhizobium sp. M4A.F.Ca.ET.020.02.1.1]|uniref:hypothetical protein n=3 Tax=Mesorhizobium TaxID=68287 RepID=UPI000FCBDB35|nr:MULTISPECIES: hypothetical protein [unclassified Mesorhizobium]RUX52903.1 hypothetical protein EOA33_00950 [Mesorhizobium sp. M4A.F.Ca.ET.050.02.1.1]RVD44072.1 hypothetical protein EN742_03280 [Mesorhizobium sp. M4A.F.Ca.ET.020.02.1.1]RWC19620.1 MAG: hypothetical protein EOS53_12645 [Mesorhizobium sp.]TIW21678.1 MAG: hypothetical protein E5V63_28755 [Mesorhizobium sp.]